MDKRKLSVKDFVKDSSALRLKSIKLPRDLSLGGNRSQKKVYKPNLNVVRNKNNIENKLKETSNPKPKQVKRKDKVKPKCIQTLGVFSEGIASDHVHVKPEVKVKHDSPNKSIPIKSQKICPEVDKKHEEHVLEDIKQCLEDSDSDLEQKSSFCAITLNKSLYNQVESYNHTIKQDYLKCEELLPTLHIWQLPDSFNFKNETKNNDFTLKNLPEGMIGKIYIKKSGKINVVIGKLNYELDSSGWGSFNEHLVSTCLDGKGSVTNLGNTQEKYILNPDWTSLL